MLVRTENGLQADDADAIIILKLRDTGPYHVCVAEYKPLPGQHEIPIQELEFIRYKSRMHHEKGAPSLAKARVVVKKLRKKLKIEDKQVFTKEAIACGDVIFVVTTPNWVTGPSHKNPFVDWLGPEVK